MRTFQATFLFFSLLLTFTAFISIDFLVIKRPNLFSKVIFGSPDNPGESLLFLQSEEAKCQLIPVLDPFHPEVFKAAVRNEPTLSCYHESLPELSMIRRGFLEVNDRIDIGTNRFSHCRYRNITTVSERESKIGFSPWSLPFNSSVLLEDDTEFIQVKCYQELSEETVISNSMYSLIPKLAHLNDVFDVRLKKREIKYKPQETLNVIMIGIDGLSRHQFLRTMPKTHRFLTETLSSFDFTMHGQLGDNTFSNFIPLLTGNLKSEVQEWWDTTEPQDAWGFMFDDIDKAGFRTLYAEDDPFENALFGEGRYVTKPLTTYWNRPIYLAMLNEKGFMTRNGSCLGSRTVSEFQLDYVLRFLERFPDKPLFALSFFDAVTHDDAGSSGVIDEHLLSFYKDLATSGDLNNSLLVLFSDHGTRWGVVRQSPNGWVDRRNPFLFLTFPPWFRQKYPELMENVSQNTRVLTTHLDTHEMLLDLLYFKGEGQAPLLSRSSKGISLFKKIRQRTCNEAHIPERECFCKKWAETSIETTSKIAQEVSNILLEEIRSRADKKRCIEFTLSKILSVSALSPYNVGSNNWEQNSAVKDYLVRLVLLPGPATFEGLVHFNTINKHHSVDPEIERFSLFKWQKQCLPNNDQKFCYCKSNVEDNQSI